MASSFQWLQVGANSLARKKKQRKPRKEKLNAIMVIDILHWYGRFVTGYYIRSEQYKKTFKKRKLVFGFSLVLVCTITVQNNWKLVYCYTKSSVLSLGTLVLEPYVDLGVLRPISRCEMSLLLPVRRILGLWRYTTFPRRLRMRCVFCSDGDAYMGDFSMDSVPRFRSSFSEWYTSNPITNTTRENPS